MGWIKCIPGKMPEDDERYKGNKVINVLVTTSAGKVTKVQRILSDRCDGYWYWGRIYGDAKAWMSFPEPYKE